MRRLAGSHDAWHPLRAIGHGHASRGLPAVRVPALRTAGAGCRLRGGWSARTRCDRAAACAEALFSTLFFEPARALADRGQPHARVRSAAAAVTGMAGSAAALARPAATDH
ncbi:hypothetical protein WS68_17325 [Burkholderia sp. TSV86]|nr:hypothetical protein WS68_17325 [Burkholderia sp. TSV86]